MAEIEGLKAVKARLEKIRRKYGKGKVSVVTGYQGVNYALYVHENPKMEARRKLMAKKINPKAQWKFLEQPAREYRDEFVRLITIALKNNMKVIDALYIAGLRLQRESQQLVPVKTGNLKGSAFTKKENVR